VLYTTLYIYSVPLLSLVPVNLRDSDILAWVQGQGKMSQVLDTFVLLDFTMLLPVFALRVFYNLLTIFSSDIFPSRWVPGLSQR
jgi:hypothetical protein